MSKKEIVVMLNNELVVSTLDIYNDFGVEHKAVITLIKRYINEFNAIRLLTFQVSKVNFGRPVNFCYLNEEHVLFLVTLMRNSDIVLPFKRKITQEFIRMRTALHSHSQHRQDSKWIENRQKGKVQRLAQTDVIKSFIEYAKNQGSKNADKYYLHYTKLENSQLFKSTSKFINLRDMLDTRQLMTISVADEIIARALLQGMEQSMEYHDIYKLAKDRIIQFAELHGTSIVPAFNTHKLKELSNTGSWDFDNFVVAD